MNLVKYMNSVVEIYPSEQNERNTKYMEMINNTRRAGR
jgi:hypothetical protein